MRVFSALLSMSLLLGCVSIPVAPSDASTSDTAIRDSAMVDLVDALLDASESLCGLSSQECGPGEEGDCAQLGGRDDTIGSWRCTAQCRRDRSTCRPIGEVCWDGDRSNEPANRCDVLRPLSEGDCADTQGYCGDDCRKVCSPRRHVCPSGAFGSFVVEEGELVCRLPDGGVIRFFLQQGQLLLQRRGQNQGQWANLNAEEANAVDGSTCETTISNVGYFERVRTCVYPSD